MKKKSIYGEGLELKHKETDRIGKSSNRNEGMNRII